MPYTRNTRIKITHHKHKTSYVAEVEYVYPCIPPILGIKVWENINDVEPNLFQTFFSPPVAWPTAWRASRDCMWDKGLEDVSGLDLAKALIDQYHKLYDEDEYQKNSDPVVEYIKYPE